jgi:hypothetical protein
LKRLVPGVLAIALAHPTWAVEPGSARPELNFDFNEDALEIDSPEGGVTGPDDEQTGDGSLFSLDGFSSAVLEPMRITLKQEYSYKLGAPEGQINNRSSVRLEYDKFFLNDYYARLDTKLTGYWGSDHRNAAEAYNISTKEAFLQGSFGNTSIKLGIQTPIWGESEGGAITDVIAPRNFSELFTINLEESRLGQPMLIVDYFTDVGDWSFFLIQSQTSTNTQSVIRSTS